MKWVKVGRCVPSYVPNSQHTKYRMLPVSQSLGSAWFFIIFLILLLYVI